MKKNAMIVCLAMIGAVALIIVLWFGKDWLQSTGRNIECNDGPRQTIDLRNFITENSPTSYELEVTVATKVRISGKIEPVLLQQLSEALQQTKEFHKLLVSSYNGCAMSKAEYTRLGVGFQAMDRLARQIDTLTKQPALTDVDRLKLSDLVTQYIALAQKAAHE
ncbi:MAG: hypothetical protein E8D41_06635 [Nitrospira sp.]|nr:MAG: hypothetical protein E8D41_06635 [Nitrospira sp.]